MPVLLVDSNDVFHTSLLSSESSLGFGIAFSCHVSLNLEYFHTYVIDILEEQLTTPFLKIEVPHLSLPGVSL